MIDPATSLVEWLANEQHWSDSTAARRLRLAATKIEHPAFDHPQHVDYLIGKTCFLMRRDPAIELDCHAEHVGFALELDDHQLAVIALRRATARGA